MKNLRELDVDFDSDQVIAWLNQDSDYYPYPYKVYLNREKGDLVCVWECDDDADTEGISTVEDNQRLRHQVTESPEMFLDIPVPNHAQRHLWFQEFLEKIGRSEEYFRSIGGWFAEYGEDTDRFEWEGTLRTQTIQYFSKICKANGILCNFRPR